MAGKKTGLALAMKREAKPEPAKSAEATAGAAAEGMKMVGARFTAVQRKAIKQAEVNSDKNLGELLTEALKDVCAKYGVMWPNA
jgi:hypothetical protein